MDFADKLFVYGSLAPGESNEGVMKGIDGTWEPAWVKGHLKQQGWGAHIGFPGIVPDKAGETVNGQVFSSPQLKAHWERLDAFEGAEYKRVLVKVNTNKGPVEAYVYELNRS